MTPRDRVYAVLRGEQPDRVPFAPYDVLVPRGDFEREMRNRGMALCARSWSVAEHAPHTHVESYEEAGVAYRAYHMPSGVIRVGRRYAGRIIDGGEIQCVYPITTVSDFAPAIELINDTEYAADHDAYTAHVRDMGADGVVRLEGPIAPYESSYMEERLLWFHLSTWGTAQADWPDAFNRLLAALAARVERMIPHILDSPADFVSMGWFGGLYSPRQFARHLLPYFHEHLPRLHASGKICSLHADAINLAAFAELLGETGVDVIEAFTPPPVGNLSLADARAAWGPDTVIWVNFPETVFWLGRQATYDYTVDLLKQDAGSRRLVLGLTEMGVWGATTSEMEHLFKEGMRAVMDAIDDYGVY